MNNRVNKYKYPGAKRLMLEAQELKDKTEDYCASPIDDNLFEWHFTVRGPPDTAFEGGYYHGRLSFPTEYPMKPPSIILLTPNGRFATNKKICLSISGYHPETWQPSWSVRTALLALVAFMPTKSNKAIGSLDFPDAERRKLAEKSRTWSCETCGLIRHLLKKPEETNISKLDRPTMESTPNDTSSRCDEQKIASSCNNPKTEFNSDISEVSQTSTPQSVENDNGPEGADMSADSHSRSTLETTRNPTAEMDKQPNESNLSSSDSPTSPVTNSGEVNLIQSTNNGFSQKIAMDSSTAITQDHRRSYPTLVYASIFILLFLLVMRRVVMLIQ